MSSLNDKPVHWRSLAELERSVEFQELAKHEFAEAMEHDEPGSPARRRFLQVVGASMAVAGCRWEKDHIVPQVRRTEGAFPGIPRGFATIMDLGGVGQALMVTSYDGRPIKVEGNANHAKSGGAATAFAQASVLSMYDSDRSQHVKKGSGGALSESTWDSFEAEGRQLFDGAKASSGSSLRFLASAHSSPALVELRRRLRVAFPASKWVEWEATSRDHEREGTTLAFGAPKRPQYALDKADTILSLDADLFARHPASLELARGFAQKRSPEAGSMNRLYAVESEFTTSGGVADHRLPLRASLVKAFAAALDAAVSARIADAPGSPQPKPQAAFLSDAKVAKFLEALADDLVLHRGRSAVLAGRRQPAEVHALAHRLNAILGNVGRTVTYTPEPDESRSSHVEGLAELVGEMAAGAVETLVVIGSNPVFDAPVNLDFAGAYAKVKNRIRLGLYEDETSRASTWHLNEAHYLETWSDARTWDGTLVIGQPLMAPMFGGRSVLELVAFVLNDERTKGVEILKDVHRGWASDERMWRRSLHDGVVNGTRWGASVTKLQSFQVAFQAHELASLEVENGSLELVLVPDSRVHDGRFANNAWLQELPDMFTKLTWENAALMSPGTAKKLGVNDSTMVKLSIGGRDLRVPALIAPGVAPGTVVLSYGPGRTAAGRVGGSKELGVEPAGANAYALRTTENFHFGAGLSVSATGEHALLATTQDKHVIDQLGRDETTLRVPKLVREQTLAEYTRAPDGVKHVVHHPPLLSLWTEPVTYEGRKWGMSVDLNKCVGCNACITACQSENNVPSVGKERVLRGREMHWIRLDRYFMGDPDDPALAHQMVTCQHCEHAPCEQVCPVGATMHSEEGLNEMVYNRCIGTRYCSNNCPYKVRRFNFHNYNELTGPLGLVNPLDKRENQIEALRHNPDVTVRFRGVMEKCSFCVQRIKAVTIPANNDMRPVKDGEIKTACQQTCPTEAIVFGDLNDPESKVRELQNRPRSYALLEELNVRPRLLYLARVRNPNPALASEAPAEDAAAGGH